MNENESAMSFFDALAKMIEEKEDSIIDDYFSIFVFFKMTDPFMESSIINYENLFAFSPELTQLFSLYPEDSIKILKVLTRVVEIADRKVVRAVIREIIKSAGDENE